MSDWLKALEKAGVAVQSAAEAMHVRGWLDTGTYALNWAVSGFLQGGYPLGRTVEIFGDPATGKSTLIARAIAAAQEAGGRALLDDVESGYSLEHTARLGVDVDALAWRSSRTVSEHHATADGYVEAWHAMMKAGKLTEDTPGVLALDSIAFLSTEHEMEKLYDKRDMTKAGEMKKFFRLLGGKLSEVPVLHLSTNHTIAAIGNMFEKRTTSGGGGSKFSASVRIDLKTVSKIKLGDADYAGVIVTADIVKNRFTAPWKKVQLAIPFDHPPSRASGLIPLLTRLGFLEEKGQFLYLHGEKVGRTYKTKPKFLDQDAQAEEILETYPDLLDVVDEMLEEQRAQAMTHPVEEEAEEEVEVAGE